MSRTERQRGWVVAAVLVGSVTASVFIAFGAWRFLDQAQRQADRVECIRLGVQEQAKDNAEMASFVLDARRTQAERADAVAGWRDDQSRVAEQIGRC